MPRNNPRISVLKLAEYMGATAVRRRAIVTDQQAPPDFKVNLYRRAVAPAVSFLRTGGTDSSILERAIEEFEATNPTTDRDRADLENSAAALIHLMRLAPELALGGRPLGRRRLAGQIWLSGVEISVRPHVRLWREARGMASVGAIKLSFAKTRPIPDEEGLRAATLLRHYIDVALEDTGVGAAPSRCQVVDVFRENIFAAPRSYRRTIAHASAACDEIRRVWPRPETDRPIRPVYPSAR